MKTEIRKIQPWAMTGGYDCYTMRHEFGPVAEALDAPRRLAAGSTVANEIKDFATMPDCRVVIGNLTQLVR